MLVTATGKSLKFLCRGINWGCVPWWCYGIMWERTKDGWDLFNNSSFCFLYISTKKLISLLELRKRSKQMHTACCIITFYFSYIINRKICNNVNTWKKRTQYSFLSYARADAKKIFFCQSYCITHKAHHGINFPTWILRFATWVLWTRPTLNQPMLAVCQVSVCLH